MKKIAVTGVSGFLGYHVTRALHEAGYWVLGIDKRPLEHTEEPDRFILTNIFDLNVRDLMGVDAIIHLAWRTNIPDCIRHPEESTRDNIDMTTHLVEVCKEAGIKKFVFPSTASLYGLNPLPWTEDMPVSPIEPYSWQKASCELLLQMNKEKLPYAVTRFFQVYGEYQREDTALAAFIRLKKAGKPITLTETMAQSKFKSGQRDFIYAGDLARAVITVMEAETNGEIYNVASGVVHTMEEVADCIGGDVVWIPRRPHEVERHEGDIKKLTSLGWRPNTSVLNWLPSQCQ